MISNFKYKKVMIVVAHPDDEILGLGATMHKLIKEEGIETYVIILGEGITSRSSERNTEQWKTELSIHKLNIKSAQDKIGYNTVVTYDFPDNRFDTIPLLDIIKVIEEEKSKFKPDIIFTHHGGDVNIDHQKTFEAVVTACRPLENETVKTIITFETPSGTEWRASSDPRHFIPNLYITFSNFDLNAKILAMESYEFERRAFPHPRSPQALKIKAQNVGINVGTEFAEAFMIIRNII